MSIMVWQTSTVLIQEDQLLRVYRSIQCVKFHHSLLTTDHIPLRIGLKYLNFKDVCWRIDWSKPPFKTQSQLLWVSCWIEMALATFRWVIKTLTLGTRSSLIPTVTDCTHLLQRRLKIKTTDRDAFFSQERRSENQWWWQSECQSIANSHSVLFCSVHTGLQY